MRLAFNTTAGTALGFALAAFYIIPAAYERRFVQIAMATIAGMSLDQNFLFEHTGATSDELLHDAVLHTASLIAVILLVTTAAALTAIAIRRRPATARPRLASETWESRNRLAFPTTQFVILTAAIALLLTSLSTPFWRHAPEMAFLQFPWRLLAVLAPIFAMALAATFAGSPGAPSMAASPSWVGRNTFAVPILTAAFTTALSLPAYHLFHQPCDPEDTVPARFALFQSNAGTDPTDEYTPAAADNDALQPNDPPYWLADSPEATRPTTALGASGLASATWAGAPTMPGAAPTHLTLTASQSEVLILNLRDYPAWRITLNGALDATRDPRPDGLIAIPIPAGLSIIDVRYARMTDQTIGDAITLLALPVFLFTLRKESRACS